MQLLLDGVHARVDDGVVAVVLVVDGAVVHVAAGGAVAVGAVAIAAIAAIVAGVAVVPAVPTVVVMVLVAVAAAAAVGVEQRVQVVGYEGLLDVRSVARVRIVEDVLAEHVVLFGVSSGADGIALWLD